MASRAAREIGQAATLMYALVQASFIHIQCGNYATANTQTDEVVALADEKSALYWKAEGTIHPRLRICVDRQSLECSPNDHLRDDCMAVNGSNLVHTVVLIVFVEGLCGTRPI